MVIVQLDLGKFHGLMSTRHTLSDTVILVTVIMAAGLSLGIPQLYIVCFLVRVMNRIEYFSSFIQFFFLADSFR